MAASLGHVLAQIQGWTTPCLTELSDAVLLERFVQHRDESAFATLVARHGAMVLHSCRRNLDQVQEIEDAFQAVFLILARKAHTLRQPAALPGYLHSIARRVARKARRKAASVVCQTLRPDDLPDDHSDPLARLTARELLTVLDEEVARLPKTQQSAIVLCCLEGRTQEEAAKMLGWTPGSLRGHLQRGRRRLQDRLARRGIALSAALALATVSRSEAVSTVLLRSAVTGALGCGIGSTASASAHSVLKTMFLGKLAGITALVLMGALAASATSFLVYRGPITEAPEEQPPKQIVASGGADAGIQQTRTDAFGDPLPDGALRRLGTQRFRCVWGINNLLLTPDGKTLVSHDYSGTEKVCVWDLATGTMLRQFPGSEDQGHIALSSDGKRVASCQSKTINVWELSSGKEVRRLAQARATGVAFSPDDKILAAAGHAPDVHLWDLASGKKIAKLPWERDKNFSAVLLSYTPDGKSLIAGQWFDSKITIWDVASGKKRQELDAKGGPIYSFALSPDGSVLATGSKQGGVPLWDVKSGQLIRKLQTEGGSEFTEVAFSPDGKRLAGVETDLNSSGAKYRNGIHIWNIATGKELSSLKGGSRLGSVVYSREGKTLIVAALGAIRLLDVTTWKEVGPTAGSLDYVDFGFSANMLSADGSTLAYLRLSDVRDWEKKASRKVSAIEVRFWDMRAGREISSAIEFDCFFGCIQFALAPDGRTVAVSDSQQAINLWDVRSGKFIRCFQRGDKNVNRGGPVLAFSRDGRMLASSDDKAGCVRLWDVATGRQIRRSPLAITTAPEEANRWRSTGSIAFSSDCRLLAALGITWGGGRELRIWEVSTGKELPYLTRVMKAPNKEDTPSSPIGGGRYKMIPPHVVFSSNGRMLAKSAWSKNIPVWEAATGRQRLLLKGHEDSTMSVAFAPDSRTLASASWDNTIRLWDLDTGRELRKLAGHRGKAYSLAFSADGKILVSAGEDTTILFWDVADVTHRKRSPSVPFSKPEWRLLWEDLAKDDATKAYSAIVRMATDRTTTVAALKERLRPVRPTDPVRMARLLKELDSNDFAVREAASLELEKLGDVVGPVVRQALERPGLSLERRRRLETISASLEEISGERLRSLRAVEVLELCGNEEAREMLKKLAAGADGARLTEEAREAQRRLARRP
jgi:RNA polymerase sigma factor (sigma-70 family)